MKLFFVVSIDTECDKGPEWKIQYPLQFRSVLEGIPSVLQPVFNEFGVSPTYLLSPEIIENDQCVDFLRSLKECELGTHLHGEFIGPERIDRPDRTSTPQLEYSSSLEFSKLKNLTELFEEKFGYGPKSFRAGRWGMSNSTLGQLEKLGYMVDSSVCPYKAYFFKDGGEVNNWGAPVQPYYPSRTNHLRKGNRRILEVPATIGNLGLFRLPAFISSNIKEGNRFHRKALKKFGIEARPIWLRPFKSSVEQMSKLADDLIACYHKNERLVLNMMFHSNEIIPGASPYVQSEKELSQYLDSIKAFLGYIMDEYGFSGKTLSEIPAVFPAR